MELKLTIVLESPVIAGGGGSNWWSVDKVTAFDEDGLFIPSTAIKGMFSEAAERFFGKTEVVKTLFGEPGKDPSSKGILNFYEARPVSSNKRFVDRVHVSISRKTRTAMRNRFFSVRAAERGQVFEATITSDRDLNDQEMGLLKQMEKLPLKIGGMKSAGYGRVKVKIEEVKKSSTPPAFPKDTKAWLLIFKVESPFVIAEDATSRRRKSYLIRSKDHVPGSSVRGALAKKYGFNADGFEELFESGKIRFPYLYPSNGAIKSIPVPATFLKPKYTSEQVLKDALVERLAEKFSNDLAVYKRNLAKDEKVKFEPAAGYLVNRSIYEPSRILSTHISMSRKLGNAEHGKLWVYDAVKPDYLVGELVGDPELITKLDFSEINVGVGKTRGFGRLVLHSVKPVDTNILQSLRKVNEYFKDRKLSFEERGFLIPLLLTSPLVGDLEKALGSGYALELTIAGRYLIKGYDMKNQAPKPVVRAIAPGSVVVYSTKKPLEEVAQELEMMKIKGLGDSRYTVVGCGSFDVYNPEKLEVKGNG